MITASSLTGPPAAARRRTKGGASGSGAGTGGGGSSTGSGILASWRKNKFVVLGATAVCFISFSAIPIFIMEHLSQQSAITAMNKASSNTAAGGGGGGGPHGVHKLFADTAQRAKEIQKSPLLPVLAKRNTTRISPHEEGHHHVVKPHEAQAIPPDHEHEDQQELTDKEPVKHKKQTTGRTAVKDRAVPKYSLGDLQSDEGWNDRHALARGLAGRPMDETPALVGAKRARIECPALNVDSLAYWNDPQGTRDQQFVSPFHYNPSKSGDVEERYISFSPDRGGWNNVRMSMEIIFVVAAATGRTLVLPPKEPLYLLNKAKKGTERHRGFADFFPLDTAEFQKRVKTISMWDFLQKEAKKGGVVGEIPHDRRDSILNAGEHCDHRAGSTAACTPLYTFLEEIGNIPNISSSKSCFVFDETAYKGETPSQSILDYVATTCDKRDVVYFDQNKYQNSKLLHFKAHHKQTRLLTHFYAMVHFTDPVVDNYYKRFVRDFLHYQDSIFCAAGKIIKAVQKEAIERGFQVDPETGGGGYSSLHVRRGELQYKKVKIPAKEWYANTEELWLPNELLYVATDERNKSFFDPIQEHVELRFLDDYWDLAGLGDIDGNYMGMIDTIVASRGRVFAGTWFSTFTGFINRMRGYHGMSMMDSWYSYLPRKDAVHKWELVEGGAWAYEWPDGWIGIDADTWPSRDEKF